MLSNASEMGEKCNESLSEYTVVSGLAVQLTSCWTRLERTKKREIFCYFNFGQSYQTKRVFSVACCGNDLFL